MSGCPHSVISGASSSGRSDSKGSERVLSVSRRSIKLLLLFSLCVVGWVISSSHHVQEFVGSGIESAAEFGREAATCIELAGSAGFVGSGIEAVAEFGRESAACIEPAGSAGFEVQHNYIQLQRTQSASRKLAAATCSRKYLSSRRSRRPIGRSPAVVVPNSGNVSSARRRRQRTI